MAQVDFIYEGKTLEIQCTPEESMKDIFQRFITKTQIESKNIYFLYNGNQLREDSSFNQVANELDKNQKKMKVIVNDSNEEQKINSSLKKSKYIICPTCGENILMSINNFKVNLFGCQNGHKFENISFKDLENKLYIDESKIKCDKCQKTKDKTCNNKLYICINCKINLCPLCQSTHDDSHDIIDYSQKNSTCLNHGDNYNNCCDDCKKDICAFCETEHKGHKIITYGNIMPKKDELKQDLINSKNVIKELKDAINKIITKLDDIINNIDDFYNIYSNIIINYVIRDKNYSTLININYMKKFNDELINYIKQINSENDFISKLKHIIEISDLKI